VLEPGSPSAAAFAAASADVSAYVAPGGVIVPVLLAVGVLLWTLLGLRAQILLGRLPADRDEASREIARYRRMIRTLYGIAPLLGLLGTVNGMIETFASLTAMQLFAQSGGVAGGISEALITTQMGLFVAIPGLIVGRLLDRREDRLRDALAHAGDAPEAGGAVPAEEGA